MPRLVRSCLGRQVPLGFAKRSFLQFYPLPKDVCYPFVKARGPVQASQETRPCGQVRRNGQRRPFWSLHADGFLPGEAVIRLSDYNPVDLGFRQTFCCFLCRHTGHPVMIRTTASGFRKAEQRTRGSRISFLLSLRMGSPHPQRAPSLGATSTTARDPGCPSRPAFHVP
jgi:hypothetical protein